MSSHLAFRTFRWLLLAIALFIGCEEPVRNEVASIEHSADTSYIGAQRCAGCHGKPVDSSLANWQSAFSKFMRDDPHRLAYRVLYKPAARQMVRNLEPTINIADDSEYGAYVSNHCSACHATPAAKPTQLTYGVGCESCHGGAANWIDRHPRDSWNQTPAAELKRHRFRDLTDPVIIAETCVGCHVGRSPGADEPLREVTHELIAAGHPALRFDFVSYFSALPKHWTDTERTTEWNQWKIGKLVSANVSLDLLEYRLESSLHESPTGYSMEFAEFDCFGCHRGLGNGEKTTLSSGELRWGGWVRGANMLAGFEDNQWNRLGQALDSASIDRPQIAIWVESLRTRIDERLSDCRNTEPELPELNNFLHSVTFDKNEQNSFAFMSWEETTQWALAMNAWIKSRPTEENSPLQKTLAKINQELKFPIEYNSPLGLDLHRLSRRRSDLYRLLGQPEQPIASEEKPIE